MSAPGGGGNSLRTEYTAPSKKKRPAQQPQRDIGVERFRRPGGTLVGEGHVRRGSAFEMLGRKKRAGERFGVARDMGGEKTRAGVKVDLDGKAGVKNKTNDPTDTPGTRGNAKRGSGAATSLDETLSGEQGKSIDATRSQASRQEGSHRALQTLRPNVVRPTPASRIIKARPGAWGNSLLMKPTKDIAKTVTYPTTNRPDSDARGVLAAAKDKPGDGKRPEGTAPQHDDKSAIKTTKRQAPVDSPSSPQKQSPQRKRKKRKASPALPVFSSSSEEGEPEDAAAIRHHGRRGAERVSRPQHHDSPVQPATLPLPDKAAVDEPDEDEDEDENDSEDEDTCSVQPSRRRPRAKAAVDQLLESNEDQDEKDDEDGNIPKCRRRARPASPPQSHDSANQPPTPSPPLSDIAAAHILLSLGAPQPRDSPNQPRVSSPPLTDIDAAHILLSLAASQSEAPILPSIPMARFPTATTNSRFTPINPPQRQTRAQAQAQAEPQPQPEPEPQPPPKKVIPHPRERPQPKKARASTPVAGPPRAVAKPKKPRATAPKPKPAAKIPAKPAKITATDAGSPAPKKRGKAAIAGKKGMAAKSKTKKKKVAEYTMEVVDGSESGDDDDDE